MSFRNSEKVSEEREFGDQITEELGEKEVHKPGKCTSTPLVSVILVFCLYMGPHQWSSRGPLWHPEVPQYRGENFGG